MRVDQAVVAEFRAELAAEFVARIRGGDEHRATDGVAAEQGSLRSAQHLHVGDVAQRHRGADGVADVHVVDVEADARIDRGGGIGLADAADEHLRGGVVARERRVVGELQVRHHLVEHVGAEHLPVFERAAGERGDRDRRLLQVFLDLAGGDDDFLEAAWLRCCSCANAAGANAAAPAAASTWLIGKQDGLAAGLVFMVLPVVSVNSKLRARSRPRARAWPSVRPTRAHCPLPSTRNRIADSSRAARAARSAPPRRCGA